MGLTIIVPSISFENANLGKVTLSGYKPIRGLDINLNDSYFATSVNLRCSYIPTNTTQRGVVWSIVSGSEYASIDGSTLTILQGASMNDVTIRCTSVANSNITVEKTIKVTYGEYTCIYDEEKTVASSPGLGISTGITPFDGNPYTVVIKTKNYQVDNLKTIISCFYEVTQTSLGGINVNTWQNELYMQLGSGHTPPAGGYYQDQDGFYTVVFIMYNGTATAYISKTDYYSESYNISTNELYFGSDGQRHGVSTGSSESRITVYSGASTDILDIIFN